LKYLGEQRLVPLSIIRVKLRHNGENQYLYIFQITMSEYWLTDDPTDYSGSGGAFFREIENVVKFFRENFKLIKYKEYEVPFELYWHLKNLFYYLYRKEEE